MLSELYQKYIKNGYKVIHSTGYSSRNEFRDLKNDMAYAIAKKPVGNAWQKSEGKSLDACQKWLDEGGWLAVVMPEYLMAVDVDGHPSKQNLYYEINKRYKGKCGIHNTNNGRHYVYLVPKDEMEKIRSTPKAISKCGLHLTYRVGGKSNIIVAPTPGRSWENFCENSELIELPKEFRPIDLKNVEEIKKALVFQLKWAYKNKDLQGNEHIDMMFMGVLVRNLGYDLPTVEDIFEDIYEGEYNAGQTKANFDRSKNLDQAQRAGAFFKILEERHLDNIKDLLSALLSLKENKTNDKPANKASKLKEMTNERAEAYSLQNNIICHKSIFYKKNSEKFYGFYDEANLRTAMSNLMTVGEFDNKIINNVVSLIRNRRNVNELIDEGKAFVEFLMNDGRIFNTQTKSLRELTDKDYFFYKLNVSYKPEAKCPRWLNFLKEIFPENTQDYIDFLQRYVGYIFYPQNVHELCLILRGDGANGKGVFVDVIKHLIGEQNYDSVSMSNLKDPYLIRLQNKLLNVCTEIDSKMFFSEDGIFKQVVSGDDITAKGLYKDPIKFRPFCKFIFSSNNPVVSADRSTGYERRIAFIHFDVDFNLSPNKDPYLRQKLYEEADGIFLWAMEGLQQVMQKKSLVIPQSLIRRSQREHNLNNPVWQFASEYVYWSNVEHEKAKCHELYEEYTKFCKWNNLGDMKRQTFARLFRGVIKKSNPGVLETEVDKLTAFKHMRLRPVPYDVFKRCFNPELVVNLGEVKYKPVTEITLSEHLKTREPF